MEEKTKFILLLEKRAFILKTLALFRERREIDVNTIKDKITGTSYHAYLLPKIFEINDFLKGETKETFIQPLFLKDKGKIVSGLKINDKIQVEIRPKFIVLRWVKPDGS